MLEGMFMSQDHTDANPNVPPSQNHQEEILNVLSRFFDIMFPSGILFGALALAISIYRSINHGWYASIILHSMMYIFALIVLIFRRRISVLFLFYSMLGLIFIAIIDSLLTMGLASDAMISLAVFCIFSGVFLGIRAGIVALIVGLLSASAIGAGVCAGLIKSGPTITENLNEPATWILHLSFIPMYLVPLILSINYMRERMIKSVDSLKKINSQLQQEISFRAVAENELKESEARYRKIFENAMEGIFNATEEGILLSVNPSMARMGGYASPEEMLRSSANLNHGFFVDQDDRLKIRQILKDNGIVKGFETRMFKHDGGIMWVSMNLQAVFNNEGRDYIVEGTIEDITKRKSDEKAIYESELKYRSVVENSLVAFYIIQDGLFRFVNARFCDMTSYGCNEIIDVMGPMDLIHADDRERMKIIFSDNTTGKCEEGEYDIKVIKKDRTTIAVKVYQSSIKYMGKSAYFGTAIDVTKEKVLEVKLLHSQKMEALGTLTGGIAHDFNNILTVMAGYGTMLQRKLGKENPLKSYADNIISASEKAANLIKGLLAFSRLQPIESKPVNINSIVNGTEKLLRRLITADILLETDIAPFNVHILADKTQIDQILFNLVANARDAMPGGGILKISTNITELDKNFILNNGFGETGKYAHIKVSDNGIGMDGKVKRRIFEPFFTTKDQGRGTGLGLSTVYGIVKQNRGYITVASDPGVGTEFDIYFPLLIDNEVSEKENISYELMGGKETILIAEDNEEVRCFIKDILQDYGYRIIEAIDGDEAIKKIERHKEISLIILDSVMPKKNGKQVYEYIKKIRSDVRIIFMSGYEKEVVMDKGIIEPGFAFITKPFSPVDILGKVEEVLGGEKKGVNTSVITESR